MRVRCAKVQQLHAMLPIVKDELVAIQQRGGLQLAALKILAVLRRIFPATWFVSEEARLVFLHLGESAFMRHGRGSFLQPDLIAVGMIAVVVGVEGKTHRLIGDRLDLRDDDTGTGGEIRVDHEHIIFKNDPAVVAVAGRADFTFVEIDTFSHLLHHVDLRVADQSGKTKGGDSGEQRGGFHRGGEFEKKHRVWQARLLKDRAKC